MNKIMASILASAIGVALSGAMMSPAYALPALQLDIAGGTYVSETTVAGGNVFDLYALLTPNNFNPLTDTYFISAAVSPSVSSNSTLGSFVFNGATVNATGDMVYGTPPLDATYPDIPGHSGFPTYYKEFAPFNFSSLNKAIAYDVEDVSGTHNGPTSDSNGTMYYMKFTVDTSGLADGYVIHFDLYNENIKNNGNKDVKFAPFSHDAESGSHQVPEPGTLLLLGSGLLGLAGFARRNRK